MLSRIVSRPYLYRALIYAAGGAGYLLLGEWGALVVVVLATVVLFMRLLIHLLRV
ncbi:hypothetical protein [Neorhodopirellula lusitana]|uniref:hypothetical protein n=1 Tax=Neorhodopirellula lusitana TaxID=445327 RepID=UPI0024B7AAC4|nr:hypothetical protein [Neorhodopirellula lusitana]